MPDFLELLVIPNAQQEVLSHELWIDSGLILLDADECDLLHRFPSFLLSDYFKYSSMAV